MDSDYKLIKELAQMGEVVLVKPDGSRITLNSKGNIPLQSQVEAVIYCLQRMDVDFLKLILDDGLTYLGMDMPTFIKKIALTFDEFLNNGDTFLNTFEGRCGSTTCSNAGCSGFSFMGNKTNNYINLLLESKDGRITDITECYSFEIDDIKLSKNEQIFIDLEFPF